MDTLPVVLSEEELKPGDLIFYTVRARECAAVGGGAVGVPVPHTQANERTPTISTPDFHCVSRTP
jgi:hypothetical protein